MKKLPNPENRSVFHEEMFKVHSHAEIEYDQEPSKVVYTEEDVLTLLRLVRDHTLEWAAENAIIEMVKILYGGQQAGDPKTAWYPSYQVSKKSILKGKTHKDLKI